MTAFPVKSYFVMAVEPGVPWPSEEKIVDFRGRKVTFRPASDEHSASLVLEVEAGTDERAARKLLQEFMSGMAWAHGGGLVEKFSVFCTTPIQVGKGPWHVVSDAPIEYVPDPPDPRAKLALALYREAISVNVIPYRFLGFFKIINILHGTGGAQKAWISQSAPHLRDRDACTRRDEILTQHGDVGDYLYHSGRCAVAHAYDQTSVVNPDDPEDAQRLALDLPVVKALAEYAVEHEFGVKSLRTIEGEHLHELEGFRALLGPPVSAELKMGKDLTPEQLSIPQCLSLRLRERDPFPSFENLRAFVGAVKGGVVQVHLQRDDKLFKAIVLLSFPDERLTFDALRHVALRDDGTATAADVILDFLKLQREWMGNGVNELWDPSTGKRLGRSAPVMLVNVRPNWDYFEHEIARLEAEREKRLGAEFAETEQ